MLDERNDINDRFILAITLLHNSIKCVKNWWMHVLTKKKSSISRKQLIICNIFFSNLVSRNIAWSNLKRIQTRPNIMFGRLYQFSECWYCHTDFFMSANFKQSIFKSFIICWSNFDTQWVLKKGSKMSWIHITCYQNNRSMILHLFLSIPLCFALLNFDASFMPDLPFELILYFQTSLLHICNKLLDNSSWFVLIAIDSINYQASRLIFHSIKLNWVVLSTHQDKLIDFIDVCLITHIENSRLIPTLSSNHSSKSCFTNTSISPNH